MTEKDLSGSRNCSLRSQYKHTQNSVLHAAIPYIFSFQFWKDENPWPIHEETNRKKHPNPWAMLVSVDQELGQPDGSVTLLQRWGHE
jgi:hypothetical protein